MIKMKFDDRILLYEYKLNDTDDMIIEYIKKDYNNVLNKSIQKIAEELFTVPNSIVRLSKKLGYKGFSELKYELKQQLDGEIKSEQNIDVITYNINKTINLIDMENIDRVVKRIKTSRKVYVLGIGDSRFYCEMLVRNLRVVNIDVECFHYRHDMIFNSQKSTKNDLFIIISVSGESKDLIEAANIVKSNNSFIVSATHFQKNSLSNISDIKLYFWAPEVLVENYNVTDRIGIMILIRIISEKVWNNK